MIRRGIRTDESGFTLSEMLVVGLVASIVLTVAGSLLVTAYRTSVFTEGQVVTINDTRNAVEQISKEIRGSDTITWCAPTGSCLEMGAQTPTGTFRTVRYRHTVDRLERQVFDPATTTWSESQTVIERVSNGAAAPVFKCDVVSSLLRVNVDLRIRPTPQSNPVYNVETSVRPRNFPSKATCP